MSVGVRKEKTEASLWDLYSYLLAVHYYFLRIFTIVIISLEYHHMIGCRIWKRFPNGSGVESRGPSRCRRDVENYQTNCNTIL